MVGGMCMLIAALAHGRGMLIAFGIAEACTVWLTVFFQINADVISRKAARALERLKKRAGRRKRPAVGKAKRTNNMITFPVNRIH